jgi:chromosome segregation ATPase
MARTATFDLSKESIFTACEKIANRGENITGQSVKNEIGGGSFNTIAPLVKEWKAKSKPAKFDKQLSEVPETAIDAIKTAASKIWEVAIAHQNAAIEAIREDCQKSLNESNNDQAEMKGQIDSLEKEIEKMEDKITNLEKTEKISAEKIISLELQIQKQQLIINDYEEKKILLKKKLENSAISEKTAEEEINRLKVENATITAKKETLTETNHGLILELKTAQEEINKLKVENATITEKAKTTNGTARKARTTATPKTGEPK